MRWLLRLLCVCALGVMPVVRYLVGFLMALAVLAFAACGDSDGESCTQPLSAYFCFSRDICPTYEEAVAEAEAALGGGYEPRPCGDTGLVVWFRNIDGGGSVLYFDDSDTLVAAESFGYQFSHCGGQILYGPVPDCPDEQWWRGSYVID